MVEFTTYMDIFLEGCELLYLLSTLRFHNAVTVELLQRLLQQVAVPPHPVAVRTLGNNSIALKGLKEDCETIF